MAAVADLITMGLLAGMTYALMSEGLWGASLMFFNALFAALISLNFYEPLAQLIVSNVDATGTIATLADCVCMMVLFAVSLLLFRLATESLSPSMVRFPTPVYHLGRIVFGLGTAMIVVGMLLLGYQASPVQKKMLGVMDFKYTPMYKERFDRDILAFFQYTTGYTFARNGAGDADPLREFKDRPMLFDPQARWLLNHQAARPYGTEAVLEEAADASAPPPAAPAGGENPGQGNGPGGQGGRPGPGIPGGTAGAAAGLAPTQ